MGNIVLLDDLTINKIAAGEVIERPASAVKELVENSIDAGATNISVEIKNGGISYIRVTDNGKGIAPDDMEIAFERHATSKIRQADDLANVRSMGFRGEALASIAAIAKVEMISKTEESDIGYKVVIEGGNILESVETGCPKGTSITIENLFYNTPVRYKFLKKDYTEGGYIEDVITRIALINPNVAIKLISSGKVVIQTTGNGSLKDVVYSIYGKEIAENVLDVDYTYEDIKVTGVIGKPSISRSNRSNQIFFVNKRNIKDKTLTASSEQAFKGMVTIGKYGFLILNLDINPQKVDVNVHPTKSEVRFEEESKVFKAVFHAIKETLLKSDLVSNPERDYDEDNSEEKNNGGLFKNNDVEYNKDNIIEQLYTQKMNAKLKEKIAGATYDDVLTKITEMKTMTTNINENKVETQDYAEENKEIPENHIEENQELNNEMKENIEEDNKEINNEIKENYIDENQSTNNEEQQNYVEDNKEEYTEGNLSQENTEQENEVNNIELQNNNIEENVTEQPVSEDTIQIQNPVEPTEDTQKTQTLDMKDVIEKSKELEEMQMEPGEGFDEMYTSIFGRMPIKEQPKQEPEESAIDDAKLLVGQELSLFESEKNRKLIPKYKFIGIAFSTYIIIEIKNEIYIIDQHAAHERIMYEKVKENYYNEDVKDSQLMLLPDVITLTHKEMDIARDNMDMFRKAGFTLDEFGENTIKLTGVPNICIDLETKDLFLETLDEINTVARTAKQEIEEKFIATVACKAAVKAHMALTKEEVDSLMEELLKLPNPFTCPHGRPTAIRMSKNDIERKFSRR